VSAHGGRAVDHAAFRDVLARFAGTLVGRYDLDDVMVEVGRDVSRTLGVAGAGVMLGDEDGRLRFVTTSDPVLERLEGLQIELDEGPCLMAFRTGEHVTAPDLAMDPRFPRFGPKAAEAGMAAVYSFPMVLDGVRIGALNLYSRDVEDLSGDQLSSGQVFADVATAFLLHARDLAQRDLYTSGLQRALESRVVVEQAKGFISARRGVPPLDAFAGLRRYAREHRISIHLVARGVIDGDVGVDDLPA
jgi:hypothetical protein